MPSRKGSRQAHARMVSWSKHHTSKVAIKEPHRIPTLALTMTVLYKIPLRLGSAFSNIEQPVTGLSLPAPNPCTSLDIKRHTVANPPIWSQVGSIPIRIVGTDITIRDNCKERRRPARSASEPKNKLPKGRVK